MSFEFLSNADIISRANESGSNSVSPALDIKGNISSKKDLYINNHISGNVACQATIFLAQGGSVSGHISTKNIIIWGEAQGDIQAENIAAIGVSATISGQVKARKFLLMPDSQLPKNMELM